MIFQYPDPAEAGTGISQLRVEVAGDRQTVTVRAHGEIDMATAGLLAAGIAYGLHSRPARVLVNLSQVTFFSAAGLRTLITARNEAAETDVDIMLDDPSAIVRTVLELSGTCGMFQVGQRPRPSARTGFSRMHADRGTPLRR